MHYSAAHPLLGMIFIGVGLLLLAWVIVPLLFQIGMVLLGVWLILYGIRLRGTTMQYSFSRFWGRSYR